MNSLAESGKWEKFFWPVLASAVFLALWHYSVVWTDTKVFPSPLAVEKGIAELSRKGILWAYIGDSLRRVALGFGAAAVVGIPLGLTLGWYPAANQVVNPVMQMLRPISPIAWIPVSIILFGVGDTTAVFLIFLAAFFPIVVACISGVSNVPSIFRRAGRNFGLTAPQLLARVVFTAARRFADCARHCLAGDGSRGNDRGRFGPGISGHRLPKLRKALRPCRSSHGHDWRHRAGPRSLLPPAEKYQVRPMGVPR